MKIDFYLRFKSQFGESLFITGNIAALGEGKMDQGLPMNFLNEEYWYASVEFDETDLDNVQYNYIYQKGDTLVQDGEKKRIIKATPTHIVVIDTWNYAGDYANVFYTKPFKEVYFKETKSGKYKKQIYTHQFKIKAPLLSANETVCILGSTAELSNWNTENPVLLQKEEDWLTTYIDLSLASFPVAYKYGIYNTKKKEFVAFEEGDNRMVHFHTPQQTIVHDEFIRFPHHQWKAAGVAIPVFSLRTKESFGIGEFTDLKVLADWASDVHLKLIQILPVNDTIATHSWTDSYPYAAISAFALHPVYINLQKVAGKKHADLLKTLAKKKKQLNDLPQIDFETVLHFKINTLRELFELDAKGFLNEEAYTSFFDENKHWLVPYAAFCYLRDKYGTADFKIWKTYSEYKKEEVERLCSSKSKAFKQILFWYFVQYHLHLQLKDAVKHIHKKGIALKGDLPIGIYRHSCDAWVNPDLFHMHEQAGAPPDDFAVKGQNWGFPTYNWQKMEDDNFAWWRMRLKQMNHYFDAFRIDHILGFFRIWSIPTHAVEGIMGRFIPALPVHFTEFSERGIWFDYDRFCKPFITEEIINGIFQQQAEYVKSTFLIEQEDGRLALKNEFSTQQQVASYFQQKEKTEEHDTIREGLFDLISNVLLFEEADSDKEKFHFRIHMDRTSSFQHLDESIKHNLKELYIHYFYHRQNEFWKKEGLKKLPALKESTNMLICGEDLGMVPEAVPEVMKDLGILSLDIQRMPKGAHTNFFNPKYASYLSVITPSTHDMSTIRAWWEENRSITQQFYNQILDEQGEAPLEGEAWINRAIIMQHLYSPAMWSIFQLQDILGMSEEIRRADAKEERINIPAIVPFYWRYRIHMNLEDLGKAKELNHQVKEMVDNSGRG